MLPAEERDVRGQNFGFKGFGALGRENGEVWGLGVKKMRKTTAPYPSRNIYALIIPLYHSQYTSLNILRYLNTSFIEKISSTTYFL